MSQQSTVQLQRLCHFGAALPVPGRESPKLYRDKAFSQEVRLLEGPVMTMVCICPAALLSTCRPGPHTRTQTGQSQQAGTSSTPKLMTGAGRGRHGACVYLAGSRSAMEQVPSNFLFSKIGFDAGQMAMFFAGGRLQQRQASVEVAAGKAGSCRGRHAAL
eukprot:1149051-Pelagomonas_calceolata.AAC.5